MHLHAFVISLFDLNFRLKFVSHVFIMDSSSKLYTIFIGFYSIYYIYTFNYEFLVLKITARSFVGKFKCLQSDNDRQIYNNNNFCS